MTERGVIASEQPHCVIASLITIRRSNPLRTPNTNKNVQRGDCFTPEHLQTLRFAMTGWSNRGDCFVASLLAMTERGVIASEQPHCVIASLITIRRSNPPRTPNTNKNVQRGNCFTPEHSPTLRFAIAGWSVRGDCFVASLLAMTRREGLAMTGKEGKAFCNKKM